MARVLSGIKPTGTLTLGNYLGALKRFSTYQDKHHVFIFIADLHALTLPIDPLDLKNNALDMAAFYLAAGLNPDKTTLFLQSHVSAHAELHTILTNYAYMGEMSRMTQFKEKTSHNKEASIGLGLFTYPVLMAADILLYNAEIIPVGDDQLQHVELTRDLVQRFNHRYGDILLMPKAELSNVGSRIMSLSDPSKKMSKSDPKGNIELKEDLGSIRKKIMTAVTDSDTHVRYDPELKPGISNLLAIYASIKDMTIMETETLFRGQSYGSFKKAVADVVCEEIGALHQRYQTIMASGLVHDVLRHGALQARSIANATLQRIKETIGLWS
jgi:tryptophanyl-tRNA synthetase